MLMFMWLIQSGTLTVVVLEFMVPGHSYLPCDRKFGQLEQESVFNALMDFSDSGEAQAKLQMDFLPDGSS